MIPKIKLTITPIFVILLCFSVSGQLDTSKRNESKKDTINTFRSVTHISPNEDVFTYYMVVTISGSFDGDGNSDICHKKAKIIYTTDGSDPANSNSAREYYIPFKIFKTTIIKACFKSSAECPAKNVIIAQKKYSIIEALPLPVAKPEHGVVVSGQKIELSIKTFEKDTNIQIFYSLDGNDPATAGMLYKEPFLINNNCVLRVIGINKSGLHLNSPILYRRYKYIEFYLPEPVILPRSRKFREFVNVSLSVPGFEEDNKTKIYYTLDGKMPNDKSELFRSPIRLSKSTEIRVLAQREDYHHSRIAEEKYAKGDVDVVPVVKINHLGGSYSDGIPPVKLVSIIDQTMILYTLDGSEPTMASTLYVPEIPVIIKAPATLKVKVFRNDWVSSVTVVEHYEYETLPAPVSDISSGSVFTDSLRITLRVPGFWNERGLKILYTLEGSDPHQFGHLYRNYLMIGNSSVLKTYVEKEGFYSSVVSGYEYFKMVKVSNACFRDDDRDGKIEKAVLIFSHFFDVSPSLIEFTNPFTDERIRVSNQNVSIPDRTEKNKIIITFDEPFGEGYGFTSGHFGRIPLPGEFGTAPFLVHDSTGNKKIHPIAAGTSNMAYLNTIKFNSNDCAVIINPFRPGKSVLPEYIQYLDDFRTNTGTAVLIKPRHPSHGTAVIYNALGNTVIANINLLEDLSTGILVLVWNGKNSAKGNVASGSYLVVITLKEKQSSEIIQKKVFIGIKK